jgi:hypothetical protein
VTYRVLLVAVALNSGVFGLLFILLPDFTISLFGGQLDALASLLVRQFGGVILGIAIFNWLLRTRHEGAVRRAVVSADAMAYAVVAAAAAYGAAAGITNGLAWVVAVFHAAVAAGLVYTYVSSASAATAETAAA